MSKVCARWISRILTLEQKLQRVADAMSFLRQYRIHGDRFMNSIYTADETCISVYDPENKQDSFMWKYPDSPSPLKALVNRSAKRLILILFFDARGVILSHAVPTGRMITAQYSKGIYRSKIVYSWEYNLSQLTWFSSKTPVNVIYPEKSKEKMAPTKLQDELVRLRKQEKEIKQIYTKALLEVQQAFDMYSRGKNNIIVWRYRTIRQITKDCIKIDTGISQNNHTETECSEEGTSNSILGAAKLFHQTSVDMAETAEIRHEIERMDKAELKRHIEQTNNHLSEMKEKLQQLNDDIMQLKGKYQESKSLFYFKRYTARKKELKFFLRKHTDSDSFEEKTPEDRAKLDNH